MLVCALRTDEGRKAVVKALETDTVECSIAPGASEPMWSADGIELRVHAVYAQYTQEQGGTRVHRVLYDFEHKPDRRYEGFVVKNRRLQRTEWTIWPNDAFLISVGVGFSTLLHQAFTPTVDVTATLRTAYYPTKPGMLGNAAVLLANDCGQALQIHKGQLLGHLQFHRGVCKPRLEVIKSLH
jgi:hypothetical protein